MCFASYLHHENQADKKQAVNKEASLLSILLDCHVESVPKVKHSGRNTSCSEWANVLLVCTKVLSCLEIAKGRKAVLGGRKVFGIAFSRLLP